jgi:hypothetical protein
MKADLSKRQRTLVREFAAKAHERAMRKLLMPLSEAFALWRIGKKDTWSLLDDMDRFSVPRRRTRERYETNSIAPMMVAHAVVAGLLQRDEVPADVLQALEKPLEFYQRGLADGTISMEEED